MLIFSSFHGRSHSSFTIKSLCLGCGRRLKRRVLDLKRLEYIFHSLRVVGLGHHRLFGIIILKMGCFQIMA